MGGAGAIIVLLFGYRAAMAFRGLGTDHPPRVTAIAAPIGGEGAPLRPDTASSVASPTDLPSARARSEHGDDTAFASARRSDTPSVGFAAPPSSTATSASPEIPPDKAPAAEHERAVLESMRRVDVIVYTTSWCPACKQARSWMNENHIAYSERDVDNDRSAHDTLKRISGGTSIPTFDVEGQVRVGLNPQWLTGAMRARRSGGSREMAINAQNGQTSSAFRHKVRHFCGQLDFTPSGAG
jgi:glutaredoxin